MSHHGRRAIEKGSILTTNAQRRLCYLNGDLAELEDVAADTVQFLDLVQHGEEVGAVLQPRVMLPLHLLPCKHRPGEGNIKIILEQRHVVVTESHQTK